MKGDAIIYTTIQQDVSACQGRKSEQGGFTLPELVICLAILSLLLGCLWQGALLALQSQRNSQEKQQVIYLAQQLCYGLTPESNGLSYQVEEQAFSAQLTEKRIAIQNDRGQCWQFYYLQGRLPDE